MELFERRVIIEQNAFLMNELFEDLKEISDESGFSEPVISHTHPLKSELLNRFGEWIDFKKVARGQIVFTQNTDPSLYAISTLKGAGLRDLDLTKSFSKMIRRKLASQEVCDWPISPDDLIERLNSSGSLHSLYNAVADLSKKWFK